MSFDEQPDPLSDCMEAFDNMKIRAEQAESSLAAMTKERDSAVDKFHAEIRRGWLACNEILDMELKAQREKYEAQIKALEAKL